MYFKSDVTLDVGTGEPIILLHGLFGNLSNWDDVVNEFSKTHRVIVPALPFFKEISGIASSLDALVHFLTFLIEDLGCGKVTIMGNSLGGHIALLYTIENQYNVLKLVLTGSSGLFERSVGNSFPRIRDYDYIREKVGYTFYNKQVITQRLIDEVYTTVQDTSQVLSLISLVRAAQRRNLAHYLHQINTSTLLVWGLQDEITPPEVALEFHDRLPNSHVRFIDSCGHVPMMEQPEIFNKYVREFLSR